MNKHLLLNEIPSAKRLTNLRQLQVTKILLVMMMAIIYSIPVYSQPAAPTSVTASPAAVCPSSPFTALKAVSAGNTIKWYVDATGGTSIGTSASNVNFNVTVSASTTYYAESFTSGGVASVTRTSISVTLQTNPQITSIPSNVSQNSTVGICGSIVSYAPATATGDPAPVISYSQSSGSNFDVGTNTVIVSASNVCATTSLSFDITVADIENPAVIAPPTVEVTAPDGAGSVTGIDLGTPGATDNCGISSITNDAPAVFYGGTTTVTWTATDYYDNTAVASQMVTVTLNNTAPSITDISSSIASRVLAAGSSASLTITWTDEAGGGPYTVDFDWNDGSSHTVLTGLTGNSATDSHTYSLSGVYEPSVTVTDGAGASSESSFQYLSVYVTGNDYTTASGSFNVPAGSLVSNPNATLPVLTHNSFTNFNASSNPGTQTTLWFSLHTKLTNSNLTANGDYILFSGGTLAFNNIGTSFGATASLSNGKIIADNTVSAPVTSFDNATNTWITRVPPAYSSSDIFIAGAAITSSTGYTVSSGKATVLSGSFSSNKSISSSWFYGLACYQPTFTNATVGSVNAVSGIPVSGRNAGTPNSQTANLVAGGTGGGGSNYTGSNSSTDNFAASILCPSPCPLSGPANLGNNCKPKSGGGFTGEMELNFNDGNFNFKTSKPTTWEYLVIDNCYLAIFSGSGTVNGSGNYGILVTQTDKYRNPSNKNNIRIKIWDKNNGDAVVFDTQLGDADNALPTAPMTSGSIKIHTENSCVSKYEGVADDNIQLNASVYPNPFASDFTLKYTSTSDEKINVSIYDIAGKKVQSISAIEPNTSFKVENNLSPGFYFIHASQGDKINTAKIIKCLK